jgi:glutaredoxin-dependent peroxiredoxin
MAVAIGKKAPNFTLFSSDKVEVSLSDFKGQNVILLFFPQAFTGVCTKELCEIRDNLSVYEGFGAKILAISVDSVFTLGKFKELQEYNFDMLSDFNKKVSKAYDAIMMQFAFGMVGVSKRATFVIDKKGIVQFLEILDSPGDYPNFAGVKSTLQNLK